MCIMCASIFSGDKVVVQDSDGIWYLSQGDRYSAVAGAGWL